MFCYVYGGREQNVVSMQQVQDQEPLVSVIIGIT